MIVAKFGGTSLASAERFKAVTEIITSNPERRIITCSAPGREFSTDIKVTDLLAQLAQAKDDSENSKLIKSKIRSRFTAILEGLGLESKSLMSRQEYDKYFQQDLKGLSPEERYDQVIALGEVFSAACLAAYLRKIGLDAIFIDAGELGLSVYWSEVSYHVHGDSYLKLKKNLRPLLEEHQYIIVPGFYGYDPLGHRRPLSRGGSDVTASWLAAATGSTCEIWTDVSGVYEADPNIIKEAWKIDYLSYEEMMAMASFGTQVLHPEAIKPMVNAGQIMYVRNSFRPQDIGTELNVYNLAKRVAPLAVSMKKTNITTLLAINGEGIEERFDLAEQGLQLLRTIDPQANIINEIKIPACLLFSIRDEYALEGYQSLWYHFIELSGWTVNADYDLELRDYPIW